MMRLALIPLTISFLTLSACSDPSSAPAPATAKKDTYAASSGGKTSLAGNSADNSPLKALFGGDGKSTASETRGALVGQLTNEVGTLYGRLESVKRNCFGFQSESNILQTKNILSPDTKTGAGGAVGAIGGVVVGAITGNYGAGGTAASKALGEGVSGDINKQDIKDGVASITQKIDANMGDCNSYGKNLQAQIAQKTAQINEMIALGTD